MGAVIVLHFNCFLFFFIEYSQCQVQALLPCGPSWMTWAIIRYAKAARYRLKICNPGNSTSLLVYAILLFVIF